ncbi:hypothetical protein [Pseudovibrio sp. POLY-S9]|uniref:hypothetical protein n=1 Tax=Pseudovibrio sp. POLY-S9 TaxID=1576596 RepID=UPI000A80A5D3|nr:hypothetical protein [Pseudovibrio sp. POLY-S9]
MAKPLDKFYGEILNPTLTDFKSEPEMLHRGFNAVAVVDSYSAHIFQELLTKKKDPFVEIGAPPQRGDDSKFRNELAKQDPNFRLLRDIAKANKHARLYQHSPKVNGSDDTQQKSLGWGEGGFGEGRYGGTPQLYVTDLDGKEHNLESLLDASLAFLNGIATKHNLL